MVLGCVGSGAYRKGSATPNGQRGHLHFGHHFPVAFTVIHAFNCCCEDPRPTAAAFSRYAAGEVLADSASLQWPGLYVRRYRFPRVVDRFLVPATPEALISCGLAGSAEFRERELGETWVTRQIGPGEHPLSPARRRPTKYATVRVSVNCPTRYAGLAKVWSTNRCKFTI
jgi:hypothetical protein